MKIWKNSATWEFGQTIISWRHRDISKFFWKIFSWLLGGFVFGITASILFIAIGQPDFAQPTARIVFFIVFIVGIMSNLFRTLLNGFEYSITQDAIIYSHPFYGWEKIGVILGSTNKPFRQTYYYMPWSDVKEIRENPNGIELVIKSDDEDVLEIPVSNVVKLTVNLNLKGPEPKEKGASKTEKVAYDKAVQKMVLQAARDARKNMPGSKN